MLESTMKISTLILQYIWKNHLIQPIPEIAVCQSTLFIYNNHFISEVN